jgi:hypothetical protein
MPEQAPAPVVNSETVKAVAANVVANNPDLPIEKQKLIAGLTIDELMAKQALVTKVGQSTMTTVTVIGGFFALIAKGWAKIRGKAPAQG